MAGKLPPSPLHRRQKPKNLVLGVVLAGFVALIYLVSLVRMGVF